MIPFITLPHLVTENILACFCKSKCNDVSMQRFLFIWVKHVT